MHRKPSESIGLWNGPPGEKSKSNELKLIQTCLKAYYSLTSKKKDTQDRRIRNAVELLVESDQRSHPSISLALCVAATEALLGVRGAELATTIAEHAACLLEPDGAARVEAVRFLKGLYNDRSRILHGEWLTNTVERKHQAREVAAAALRGVIEHRDFCRRVGLDVDAPDALHAELQKNKLTSGEIPGISNMPVRRLWRDDNDN